MLYWLNCFNSHSATTGRRQTRTSTVFVTSVLIQFVKFILGLFSQDVFHNHDPPLIYKVLVLSGSRYSLVSIRSSPRVLLVYSHTLSNAVWLLIHLSSTTVFALLLKTPFDVEGALCTPPPLSQKYLEQSDSDADIIVARVLECLSVTCTRSVFAFNLCARSKASSPTHGRGNKR